MKLYLLPINLVKRVVLLIAFQIAVLFCNAQSYTGYHSSAYAGVYSILTNPADILNHRYRGDINLFGFSTTVGNSVVRFKYKDRNDDKGGISFPEPVKKNGKGNFNTDVFGPSVLVKLSDKNAIALTTRVRMVTNLHGISSEILNSLLPDAISPSFIGTTLNISNMSVNAHAWKEAALTYSRQVANNDFGVWKAGASIKLLGGLGAFSLRTNNLSFVHDSIVDPADGLRKDAIINARGNVIVGYTRIFDSAYDNASDYLSFKKNPGVGLDIGVSYEFRDEMQVYQTLYNENTASYVWKLGASITDIGFIRYNKNETHNIITKATGNTYLVDQLSPPSDSSEIYQMGNYYKNLFKARTDASALTMQLPTTLHLTYDRFFNKWLGVQGQLNVPLVFSKFFYYTGNYTPVSIAVTPRAEISWAGLYMPISYNSISGFQAGAAFRLGPLVIGSSSIINFRMSKTKGGDAYFILRIPLFGYRPYKQPKDRFETHPRLTKKQRKALDCPGK